MALNVWVTWRTPAPPPTAISSQFASVCPAATTTPRRTHSSITPLAPRISGASATRRTTLLQAPAAAAAGAVPVCSPGWSAAPGRCGNCPGRISSRRQASAASGRRIPLGSWAPARAGLIQGPSRCAPENGGAPVDRAGAARDRRHGRLEGRRRRRPGRRQQRGHAVAGVEAGHPAQPVRIGVHGVGAVTTVDVDVDEPRQQHTAPAVDHHPEGADLGPHPAGSLARPERLDPAPGRHQPARRPQRRRRRRRWRRRSGAVGFQDGRSPGY